MCSLSVYTHLYINYIFLIFLLTGGAVDGPFNGAAPTPWSIPIQPEQMFRNHEKSCEVSDLFKMSGWNTPPEILVVFGYMYMYNYAGPKKVNTVMLSYSHSI